MINTYFFLCLKICLTDLNILFYVYGINVIQIYDAINP